MKSKFKLLHYAIIAATIVFLINAGCDSRPSSSLPQDDKPQAVINAVLTNTALTKFLDKCPADYYGARGHRNQDFNYDESLCRESKVTCLEKCKRGSASHCQNLAFTIQHQASEDDRASESLFSLACSFGIATGCTNRGAGISYHGGEFGFDVDACLLHTFKKICEDNDLWGCAMYAFELLEADPANLPEARLAVKKSCDIDPDFQACHYAQSLIEESLTPQ